MKVMELWQLPVFAYPGSIVMYPVCERSLEMSMARSPSVPSITGNSYSLPSMISVAVSVCLAVSTMGLLRSGTMPAGKLPVGRHVKIPLGGNSGRGPFGRVLTRRCGENLQEKMLPRIRGGPRTLLNRVGAETALITKHQRRDLHRFLAA